MISLMPRFRWPSGAAAWITAAAVIVFTLYALSFLYFFVDDEAIPLVYAQNMNAGRGLVYNTIEGRVEGYSDFLLVMWDAVLLRIVRGLGYPKLTVLEIGKAVSFAAGVGVVLMTARLLRRDGASSAGLIAALAFLGLAGPLAVWSCSALEEVPFALLITVLASLLFIEPPGEPSPTLARWCVGSAALAVLCRIDGFVHIGAVLCAALLSADQRRRAWIRRRVVAPVLAIAAIYHAARFAYFGTLLSAPLEAKVLYKLTPNPNVLVKRPEREYLAALMDMYGIALVPALLVAAAAAWPRRLGRPAAITAACLGAYAAIVGDWMFGWRFLVPLFPFVAMLIGSSVSRLRGRIAWLPTAVVIAWSAIAAHAFAREYGARTGRPLWWSDRHAGIHTWLMPYSDLITVAGRAVTTPGQRFAYNQAGLLPYLLDVDNVDDLGICSRFVAGLPTTDVYFTEVGRYSPLTNAPVLRAAHAYLLYLDVRTIAARTDLLRNANDGRIPPMILDDHFRLRAVDASGNNALYIRTEKPAVRYRTDAAMFQENLAHTSRVRRVDINGERLADAAIGPTLPFLRDQAGSLPVTGRMQLVVQFADQDEDVFALYAGSLSAPRHVTVTFGLYNAAGHRVAEVPAQVGATATTVTRELEGVRARLLTIDVDSPEHAASLLTIRDLRVQGQSASLGDYVRRHLRFPV
jgi:hypothetical protein